MAGRGRRRGTRTQLPSKPRRAETNCTHDFASGKAEIEIVRLSDGAQFGERARFPASLAGGHVRQSMWACLRASRQPLSSEFDQYARDRQQREQASSGSNTRRVTVLMPGLLAR